MTFGEKWTGRIQVDGEFSRIYVTFFVCFRAREAGGIYLLFMFWSLFFLKELTNDGRWLPILEPLTLLVCAFICRWRGCSLK